MTQQQQLPNVFDIVRRHIQLAGCKYGETPDDDMCQPELFIIQFHMENSKMSTPLGRRLLAHDLRNMVIRSCRHITRLKTQYGRVTVTSLKMVEERRFGDTRSVFRLKYYVAVADPSFENDVLAVKLAAVKLDNDLT